MKICKSWFLKCIYIKLIFSDWKKCLKVTLLDGWRSSVQKSTLRLQNKKLPKKSSPFHEAVLQCAKVVNFMAQRAMLECMSWCISSPNTACTVRFFYIKKKYIGILSQPWFYKNLLRFKPLKVILNMVFDCLFQPPILYPNKIYT